MKWFSGSIGEAITLAQKQKATFVAFVEGEDEKSKMMTPIFDDREVCNSLETDRFVCIIIQANSVGYRQFVEIYKTVPVPSLFYISHSGVPLDVVSADLFDDVSDLKIAILTSSSESNLNQTSPGSNSVSADKLLEQRQKEIDDILEKRRQTKECQKSSKQNAEKKEELEKKKTSTEDQKAGMKDAEMKKLIAEREKDKKEEAMAKQKILDQIAQDRAEKAERMKHAVKETTSKQEIPSSNSSPSSTHARIQFKLPTGESKSGLFLNGTTLSQIRDYIDNNLDLPYRDYKLATTFPRREFTADDNESTLETLNLRPTAVLLILTKAGKGVNPYKRNWFKVLTDMFQDLIQPLYSISNYLRGFIFRSRDEQAPSGTGSQQPTPQPSSSQDKSRTYVRRAGNIHSLRDLQDGNDENNTWNGNSTQQM